MVRFTPGCCWCGDGECPLCDSGTIQEEYDVTLWVNDGAEQTITVSGPVHRQDTTDETYGCCTWLYEGVLGDINGIADEELGDCTAASPLTIVLALHREYPGSIQCIQAIPAPLTYNFRWTLTLRVPCEDNQNELRGKITWPDIVKFSGDPDVPNNETVTCDLSGDDELDFSDPSGDGDDTCIGVLARQGCIDCDYSFGPNPGDCRFPTGGANVSNAA
jgi:hypothetical protein